MTKTVVVEITAREMRATRDPSELVRRRLGEAGVPDNAVFEDMGNRYSTGVKVRATWDE